MAFLTKNARLPNLHVAIQHQISGQPDEILVGKSILVRDLAVSRGLHGAFFRQSVQP